jgi:hypothetical protein
MPNHIQNEVIIPKLAPRGWRDLRPKIINGDEDVDFSLLLPSPLNSWPGSVNMTIEKAFPMTDLNWNRANWGTKWNAYQCVPVMVDESGTVTIRFQTAWNPPMGWLCAVFRTVNMDFEHRWYDEGGDWTQVGKFSATSDAMAGGPDWSSAPASDDVHLHVFKLFYGCTPEELDALNT